MSRKVEFDLFADRLNKSAVPALEALVSPAHLKEIGDDLQAIKAFVADRSISAFNCMDFVALDDLKAKCDNVLSRIDRLRAIGYSFPWRLGMMERAFLDAAKPTVRGIKNDYDVQGGMITNGG